MVRRTQLLSLLGLLLPVALVAQSERSILLEIPAVFGASRFDQAATEAPASVTVVLAEDIDRFGWRTLAEVLRGVRGFFVSYDRTYQYLGVRGFSRPGDYNSRVLLLIDGNRINENIYDGGYIGEAGLIDLQSIDRIEVIRGPASSLYGGNAFFGIINMITVRGRAVAGARIGSRVGSYGLREARGAVGHRFGNGLDISASGLIARHSGQDLYFPEYDQPATAGGQSVGADREDRENAFLKASWGSFTLEGSYNDRVKAIPTGAFGTNFNDGRSTVTDRQALVSLGYDRQFANRAEFKGSVEYHRYDYTGAYYYGEDPLEDEARGRWWIAEGQWLQPIARTNRLVLGVTYRDQLRQEQGAVFANPYQRVLLDNRDTDELGFYAQDEQRLGRRWVLSGGLRWDGISGFAGSVNPRLGLIYAPGDGSAVKLLYGTAFRPPNAFERYYHDDASIEASPGLGPERVATADLLVERPLGRRLKGTVSAYRYDLTGLISQVVDSANGMLQYRNLQAVRGEGLELELAADLGVAAGRVSYALQRTFEKSTGTALTNSPTHLLQLQMSSPLIGERLRASVEGVAMSRRQSESGAWVPGYAVANLSLRSQALIDRVSIRVGLYNVFDRRYGDPTSADLRQNAIPQDRRHLAVDVEFRTR